MDTRNQPNQRNPWVIYRFGDVLGIFGIGFWFFVGLQVGSSALIGHLLGEYFGVYPALLAGGLICLLIIADGILYVSLRGRDYRDFFRPAMIVAGFTVVPSAVLWIAIFLRNLASAV